MTTGVRSGWWPSLRTEESIEPHTDEQAERVATVLGDDCVTVWRCKGFKTGGGAFDRWHITSTDIHDASFPLLKTIVRRGFAHAVAFHGFSEADVLVGGAAPLALKQEIAAALEQALAWLGHSASESLTPRNTTTATAGRTSSTG